MAAKANRLILVTGGSGYVGTVLVPALAEHYRVRTYDSQLFGNFIQSLANVESLQGDIRDEEKLVQALAGVTDVIHLAGIVTDELVDMNPDRARDINCLALMRFLTLCVRAKIQRFILMSSSSVYGPVQNATELDIPHPRTQYARQKLLQEAMVAAYSPVLPWVIIRSATLCGPAPRMRLDTIVNTFCKQAWFDKRITVWGGTQIRTNVHVGDLVRCYLWLLREDAPSTAGEIFNITSGNHSAAELAAIVRDIHGSAMVAIDKTKVDLRNYSMMADKAKMWGWKPWASIAQAVRDNFEWFAAGKLEKPNDDIYYNNRRLAPMMKEGI